MINFNDKINLIWQIAESLRGVYKPEKYGDVILPMCVIKRFDEIISEKKEDILKAYNLYKNIPEQSQEELIKTELDGLDFYNISAFGFDNLCDDQDHLKENFIAYLQGFSSNIKDIIAHFDFNKDIDKLAKNNQLYHVIQEFKNVDLHPNRVDNQTMGYIFEELIRKFKENAEAGDHYTPREVIELCMKMLFMGKSDEIKTKGKVISIADFCCGTGGMLSVGQKYILEQNKDAKVELYGQEINDESYAICKADMLIKGQDTNNIVFGNTLTDDGHKGKHYRYLISNPPFGVQWKKEQSYVTTEHTTYGFAGRFGAGVPRVSDGSLLFLQNMISKMVDDENGSRIAIIFNGSPLFTGDAGGGESNIRKWIIESDMLEGIISLPTDLFYNTGISTYIWVLTNKKEEKRRGKIELVNASDFSKPMRKSLGSKRKFIDKTQIDEIEKIYQTFQESKYSKIFDNSDFGYTKITIERPKNLEELKDDEKFESLDKKEEIAKVLQKIEDEKIEFSSRNEFVKYLKIKLKPTELNLLIAKDTESIPLKKDIKEYFKEEVKPHLVSAWMDESTFENIGYEIPFTRHFYEYKKLESFEDIMKEIRELESSINDDLKELLA
ncbi:type I restriction-modification system subunit M [Arcobacter ellisii]|uniref:site-specific DNA-methyltransferase (adenine-specific) n=1 Tax=Arcobacter ellisii TaxID=913109 RepID=A0A347U997_9BACT|nr:class I SAM-dependent DNA methyltransferase [Arcobacter ellisii]AXX95425.1 type I restriction/modification system, methylation subunit [Arcobacter ellisii]RXI29924.1 restriction endonuclease subunit M [Arcobacter ellisii]